MLRRGRTSRHASGLRHSFAPGASTLNSSTASASGAHPGEFLGSVPVSDSEYNIAGRSMRAGPVRVRASRRLSQKYQRSGAGAGGRRAGGAGAGAGAGAAKEDKAMLFKILFPRKRYSEMHDVEDDMSRLLRNI